MKKFLKSPWTITIGSGLLILIITTVIDYFTAERLFSTIKTVIFFLWKIFISFLNLEIKVWWVLAGFAVIILGLVLYSKYLDSKPSESSEPEFISYKRDTILDFHWKWHWEKDCFGKYDIEDLHPVCSKCETPLTREHGYGEIKCLRCGERYYNDLPYEDEVKILIRDNVRRQYFPDE